MSCSCPYCEGKNRERRALKILDRLELARRGRPVIYTIFTVPPQRREAAAEDKAWRKWLRQLIAYLKKNFDLEYAVERTDPCGEDGETWHPHVNLVWIRRSGKGFLEPEELASIKARWAKIIKLEKDRPIDVFTSYTREAGKIRHLASYLGRCFPRWADGQKYLLRVKWFGKPPKVERPEGPHLCDKCGLEVVEITCGSLEAAQQLAAHGYGRLLEEQDERRRQWKRSARVTPWWDGLV